MKRFMIFFVFILALAFITINLPGISPANSETLPGTKVDVYDQQKLVKSVVFAIGINEYYVNGITPGTKMDARPYIKDGRTFVPVRYLGNALGVTDDSITWNGSQNKAALRLGQNTVEMVIGVQKITTNGQNKDIDVAPVLNETEGRTYLPARYIAEGLGYEVGWDEVTQTVLCWPKGEAKPDVSAVKQVVQRERALLEGKAPEGYKVTDAGYIVPKPENTKMKIWDTAKEEGSGVDLHLVVYLPSSEYAKARLPKEQWRTEEQRIEQLKQVEEILTQKHGREIARAVVEYAGQKKMEDVMELEHKAFPIPGGGKITVMSSRQANFITIDVWRV